MQFTTEKEVARWVAEQPDDTGPRRLQALLDTGRLTAVSKQVARAWLARHPLPPADRPYAKYNSTPVAPRAGRRTWIAGAAAAGVAALIVVAYALVERSS